MKLTTPFYIEKRQGEGHVDLCGEWEFTYIPKAVENPESVKFPHEATLPASAYWNVYEAGILPHPYEGTNSKLYRELDRNVWYYRKSFTLDQSVNPELENAFLCFDGVGYYSRLWLNGELLGEHEGMFGGPVCDIAEKLICGKNEIILEVKPYNYDMPEEKRSYGKKYYHNDCPAIIPWNIAKDIDTSNGDFQVFGIWREVRIEIMPKKHIARPYLYTKSIDGKNAVLGLEVNIATELIRELEVKMSAGEDYDYTFAYRKGLSGILSGEKVDIRVVISDENRTVFDECEAFELYDYEKSGFTYEGRDLQIYRKSLHLSDIEFWYPNGLGEAKLYDVKIELSSGGLLLDTLTFKTGIRTIEQTESAGRKYRQRWDKFHFVVNGEEIFLKGMNWMPTDYLYDESYEDTLWALEQVKNEGIQLLRVWSGGGKPESDIFYDICDRLGIMVWQDAFLANHNSPLWNGEILENQVCYYLYRIRNHTSLAVHCGGNEQRGYHVDNNAAQYIIQRNIEDLDFTRKYYRVSPDRGSMHTYNDMEPIWFRKMYGDLPFMAECGIHCFPNAKSLRQVISEKEYSTPLNDIMNESFRAKFPELLNHFTEYRPDRVPRMLSRATHIADINGISLEGLCEATQMAAYEFYRILGQSLREAYPGCVGLMPWVFKRTWTTTAIQMVDGLGEPVAPYYAVKRSYSDIDCLLSLCELDYAPGEHISVPVKVINGSKKGLCGKVYVCVYSPSLERVYENKVELTMSEGEYIKEAASLSFDVPTEYSDKYFFARVMLEADGKMYSAFYPLACLERLSDDAFCKQWRKEAHENLYFDKAPHQKPQVQNSKKSVISASVIENIRHGNRISTRVKLKFDNAPAYPVRLLVLQDETVSYLSDNFFFADVGEEREITIETRNKGDLSRPLTLEVTAWNADAVQIEI